MRQIRYSAVDDLAMVIKTLKEMAGFPYAIRLHSEIEDKFNYRSEHSLSRQRLSDILEFLLIRDIVGNPLLNNRKQSASYFLTEKGWALTECLQSDMESKLAEEINSFNRGIKPKKKVTKVTRNDLLDI
jgi:hypothetical protein